ncbi:hypothetical protein AAVH_18201, partial [Aphelenchoides avenae]
MRLVNAQIIPLSLSQGTFGRITSIVSNYCELLMYSLHVLISVNRYKAISNPTRQIQQGKLVLAACFVAPALVRGSYTFFVNACTSEKYIQSCMQIFLASIYIVPLAYSAAAAIISGVLDVRTFLTFKAYNSVRRHEHREDFLLLNFAVYAVLQFIFMIIMTVCNGAIAVQFLQSMAPHWLQLPQEIISYNFDLVCFSPPFCLLST